MDSRMIFKIIVLFFIASIFGQVIAKNVISVQIYNESDQDRIQVWFKFQGGAWKTSSFISKGHSVSVSTEQGAYEVRELYVRDGNDKQTETFVMSSGGPGSGDNLICGISIKGNLPGIYAEFKRRGPITRYKK